MRRNQIFTLALLLLTSPSLAKPPAEPEMIVQDPRVGILQHTDGSFSFFNLEGDQREVIRHTLDGRQVKLEPAVDFELPAETTRQRLLLDEEGELHEIYLKGRGTKGEIAVERFIDLWHRKTTGGRAAWSEPQMIWDGYCGAIMHSVHLPGGRLLAPFGEWLPKIRSAPPTGPNVVTAVYSDDQGESWQKSPAQLVSPCYEGYNGSNYGACEPVVLKLADGRLTMLMRTQTGFLYESSSDDDGRTWRPATASRFHSSSGPPGLTRLSGGQIVLFWNNCTMPPRFQGDGVYGGRDALHAAISDDEGTTWRGFREVYRDPYRNETPPKRGDRGTAYPFGAYDAAGNILLVSGQGHGRRNFIRIDPDWLHATSREDDFSAGLEGWHVFKGFGPAVGWWRDRTTGAALVDHPDKPNAKALALRRLDERDPDGAAWNFPMGWQGELTLRVLLREGFQGASIVLNDRMFEPTDPSGERLAIFQATIDSHGRLGEGATLELGKWHTLKFRWDLDTGKCSLADGDVDVELEQQHPTNNGVCYLGLRSKAQVIDTAGFLVDYVRAEVTSPATPPRSQEECQALEQHFLATWRHNRDE